MNGRLVQTFAVVVMVLLALGGCKTCKKGKPCGKTCISKQDTCHID
jgi:hypothetical protein